MARERDNSGSTTFDLITHYLETRDATYLHLAIEQLRPRLVRTAHRALGAQHDLVDDAIQATLIDLWRQAAYVRSQRTIDAWLQRITLHKALALARADARHSAHVHQSAADGVAMTAPDPTQTTERAETCETVYTTIAAMPHGDRAPIELSLLEGLSDRTIAHRLGIPLGTVKSRLRRAKRTLRDALR